MLNNIKYMKNIVESINEGVGGRWGVTDSLSRAHEIASFNVRDAQFMWIGVSVNMIGLISQKELEGNFHDFEMEDKLKDILRLRPGESWTIDGDNIYVRL